MKATYNNTTKQRRIKLEDKKICGTNHGSQSCDISKNRSTIVMEL